MSESLKAFLTAWIKWVDAGAKECSPFARGTGLCYGFEDHLLDDGFTWKTAEVEINDMKALFANDGLDRMYPFGGEDVYSLDLANHAQHLNKARVEWVRSKVAQFAEA